MKRTVLLLKIVLAMCFFSGCGPMPYIDRVSCGVNRASFEIDYKIDELLKGKQFRVVVKISSLEKGERVVGASGKWLILSDSEPEELYYYYDEDTRTFYTLVDIPVGYTLIPFGKSLIYEIEIYLLRLRADGMLHIDESRPLTIQCNLKGGFSESGIVNALRWRSAQPAIEMAAEDIDIGSRTHWRMSPELAGFWRKLRTTEMDFTAK